jgi:type II secretory pathway pseudopilin PulG
MRRRAGFTLVEILVAMTLTLAIFAITLPFVRAQTRALGANASRLDAEQIARYAQRAIDRDLRLASADSGQSLIVHAGTMGITFTANLIAVDTTDAGALEVVAGAASTLSEAWRVADAATIPMTSRSYPPVDYTDADGGLSGKETISYFLHPDTISDRSDIYVLYRRVNARDSVLIVRGIHVPTDSAYFSYLQLSAGVLTPIAVGDLPLYWDSTAVSTIRAVGLRSAGFFRNRQDNEDVIRTVYWTVVMPNADAATAACTGRPAPATVVAAANANQTGAFSDSTNKWHVRVTWTASTDDVAGGAVRSYAIERDSGGVWRQVASVPARAAATYRYDHAIPLSTGSWTYGVRAIDCASTSSTRASASAVTLP